MRKVLFLLFVVALAGCQSSANMTWTRIGNGPPLEYAEAQCNIAAMGTEQQIVAWGSPGYVAGAQLGNAIGNEMRRIEFMKNCMVLQGWKQVPKAPTPPTSKPALTAEQRKNFVSAMAMGRVANSCSIPLAKDKKALISEIQKASDGKMIAEAKQEATRVMNVNLATMSRPETCKKARSVIKDMGWL